MKYYYSFFRDNNTEKDPEGQLYKVVIKTKKGDGVEELLLNGSPFTVNYESSDLYKPYKCSTATVGLLNLEYNKDFICDSITDNEVTLYRLKDGEVYSDDLKWESSDKQFFNIEWTGYTMPNVYSQDYKDYYDTYQMECQDKLSILKYYRYEDIDHFLEKPQRSLFQLMFEIMMFLKLPIMNVTKSLVVPNESSNRDQLDNFCERVYFLRSSFFNEEGTGKYMTEILEDILNYLSLTIMQVRDEIYVVNYNAISTGFTEYTRYNLNTGQVGTAAIDNYYDVDKDYSAANDTNLSIVESYDDFSIEVASEPIDRTAQSVDWWNKTPSQYTDPEYESVNGKIWTGGHPTQLMKSAEWDGYSIFQQYSTTKVYGYTSLQFYSFNEAKKQPYAPNIIFHTYEQDQLIKAGTFMIGEEDKTFVPGQCQLIDMTYGHCIRNHVSSFPISYALLSEDEWQKQVDKDHKDGLFICHPITNAQSMTDAEWEGLITNNSVIKQQPMLEIEYNDVSITKDHPLVFHCNVEYFPDYIPCMWQPSNKIVKPNESMWMAIKIETGDKTLYYSDWQDNPGWFPVRQVIGPKLEGVKWNEDMYGSSHPFNNNPGNWHHLRKYTDGIVIDGYGEEYTGKLTIIFYRPWGPDQSYAYITASTLITDINLEEADRQGSETVPGKDESIKYGYKDKSRFINEQMSETLQYSTHPFSPNSKNQVFTKNDGVMQKLEYVLDIPSGDALRPEEHRLRNYVRQMSAPSFTLNSSVHYPVDMITRVTYHRFPDTNFVVDGLTVDYRNNIKTFNITEKK